MDRGQRGEAHRGFRRRQGLAVAGEAHARCRESPCAGKTRGGAARDGELGGGLRACRGASRRRLVVAADARTPANVGVLDAASLLRPKALHGFSEMRRVTGFRMDRKRTSGTHGNGREPQNTAAERTNSDEEFPQPGGMVDSGFKGEMRRRGREFIEKSRGINCGLNFSEINGI